MILQADAATKLSNPPSFCYNLSDTCIISVAGKLGCVRARHTLQRPSIEGDTRRAKDNEDELTYIL